jgi:hypothetical protein
MLASFDGPERVPGDLRVGEIRALRTFRLGQDGSLLPVAHRSGSWSDGPNTARCERGGHTPAAPGCSCGFYAYGTRRAALQHDESRRLLAVVACWGRVVPGTLGLRAQHARIEALWVSSRVNSGHAALVRRRYPSVMFYTSRRDMLREHRLTRLDSYERPPRLPRLPRPRRRLIADWFGDDAEELGGCLLRILVVIQLIFMVIGFVMIIKHLIGLL